MAAWWKSKFRNGSPLNEAWSDMPGPFRRAGDRAGSVGVDRIKRRKETAMEKKMIAMEKAWVCLECKHVFEAEHTEPCPKCGSGQVVTLYRFAGVVQMMDSPGHGA